MSITEQIYLISSHFPAEERFGLTSQIRRTAVSIPSNIAEGAGRNTNGEFRNFLGIASGSINELITQILLVERMNFLNGNSTHEILDQVIEVQKMIFSFKDKIRK